MSTGSNINEKITFSQTGSPTVSVIVIGWRDAPRLLACLESLAMSKSSIQYEVVLTLNEPTQGLVRDLAQKVEGLQATLTHEVNLGFGEANNRAVLMANAPYLMFLNDDTIVSDHWLDSSVEILQRNPDVGAVGSLLLNPDRTVQDAGCLVWSDGSIAVLDHVLLDGRVPATRRVMYCSAAALLVKRDDFLGINGFHQGYYPAYYEDVDLCLSLQENGRQTWLNSGSSVIHFRSESTNRAFQQFCHIRNYEIFKERWSDVLSEFLNAPSQSDLGEYFEQIRSAFEWTRHYSITSISRKNPDEITKVSDYAQLQDELQHEFLLFLEERIPEMEKKILRLEASVSYWRAGLRDLQVLVDQFQARRVVRLANGLKAAPRRLGRLLTQPLRRLHSKLKGRHRPTQYKKWIGTVEATSAREMNERMYSLGETPLISLITPVFNTPAEFLHKMIESVRSQSYENWELLLADDASTDEKTIQALRQHEGSDDRIKVIWRSNNGHISEASNTAIEHASGSWIAILDHDDELNDFALAAVAVGIEMHPNAGFVYSDYDQLTEKGERVNPFFKTDFDDRLILGQNFLCHLAVVRKDLIDLVGGFTVGLEGSQDWDLFLRVLELLRPDQVIHLPYVLYHWRMSPESTSSSLSAKPYAAASSLATVRRHLERESREAVATLMKDSSWVELEWVLPNDKPSVALIIPTKDGPYLEQCLHSIFERTTYSNYEVVLIDNGSEKEETLSVIERYRPRNNFRVIYDASPFNFSKLNNDAVATTLSDFVCLMNDDIEIQSDDWLDVMLGEAIQPQVGIVGAKLYYPDGRIQHCGIISGFGGIAANAYVGYPWDYVGNRGDTLLSRNVSAVTGACMLVRRDVWDLVGGLDEHFAVDYNDVDFCLAVKQHGWKIIVTPSVRIIHHESASRGKISDREFLAERQEESLLIRKKWADRLTRDPFYNINLTVRGFQYELP